MTETPALKSVWSENATLRYELTEARRRLDAADRLYDAVCRELRAIGTLADAAPALVVAANDYERARGGVSS